MNALPQILLILVVLGLFIAALRACFGFGKGAQSISKLENHLILLKSNMDNHSVINPALERSIMERLLNNLKTSCSQKAISDSVALKELFSTSCQTINARKDAAPTSTKTLWLQYSLLMNGFNEFYFKERQTKLSLVR